MTGQGDGREQETPDLMAALRRSLEQGRVTCTGVAATWCPVHGDCSCRSDEDYGSPDVRGCPLHDSEDHPIPAQQQELPKVCRCSAPGNAHWPGCPYCPAPQQPPAQKREVLAPLDPEDQDWVDTFVAAPPGVSVVHTFPENAPPSEADSAGEVEAVAQAEAQFHGRHWVGALDRLRAQEAIAALDAHRALAASPDVQGGDGETLRQTPADGHTFRFQVISRGSYPVMPEGETTPRDYLDSDWEGDPWTMEVRAWSLRAALELAAEQPLGAWRRPNGKRLDEE